MDFSLGLPPQSRTLVVVPTMLTGAQGIDSLVEALEVRFLANRDAHLHFGLLTDFQDAATETVPEDAALLLLAQQGIERLNEKYAAPASPAEGRGLPATLLSVSPPAPVESRENGCGWGTSARGESSRT